MGDEIRDPQRTLPGAVAWGGVLSGLLYIGTTLTLLIAVGKNDISVLQGIVQAVSHMASRVGVAWIAAPFALMLSLSIAGIGSAWMGGSARIPFVAGLDSYMPSWLGKVHPKYATPYAALIVQAIVSLVLVVINFAASGGVQEAFQTMLSLAVVLQLVPFIYVFAALLRFVYAGSRRQRTLQQRHTGFVRSEWFADDDSRNCAGIFSGQADHIDLAVRSNDVRAHGIFRGTGSIFLFRLWTTKIDASSSKSRLNSARTRRDSRLGCPSSTARLMKGIHMAGGVKTDVRTYQLFINGEWVDSKSNKTFPVYDPASEEVIAQVPDANADDVNRAVSAARAAFENGRGHDHRAGTRTGSVPSR